MKTTSTHAHGHTASRIGRELASHCLLGIIFSFSDPETQTHLLLIVFCVLTRGWCPLVVLWYLFKGTLVLFMGRPVPKIKHYIVYFLFFGFIISLI